MGIFVENGGFLTTVQDEGRFGYQQYGVSPTGPMDLRSFHIANLLVGNDMGEGALEATILGPSLRFEEANIFAVAGGDLSPQLNGVPVENGRALLAGKGDVLSFAGLKNGARAYIAFAGGLDIKPVMGSKSTHLRAHFGGYEGRKLEKGDRIVFTSPKEELPDMHKRCVKPEHFAKGEVALRVVTGPQDDRFTLKGLREFFWFSREITNEFDRQGCRLMGAPVEFSMDANVISDGISFGSIQVPPNGQPIIMLCDRQSTGGYAKIGTVISVDLPLLAQAMPGMRVRFIRVGLELAQELYVKELGQLKRLEEALTDK